MSPGESWSVVASIVSIILAVVAIGLAVFFFVVGRNTEIRVGASLSKIETQAEMLQKLTGRQLERLTRFVTEDRRPTDDPKVAEFMNTFMELAKPHAASLGNVDAGGDVVQLRAQLLNTYVLTYYYVAVSNYWAQFLLPDADEYEAKNDFHVLARRMVDQSATDFAALAQWLSQLSKTELSRLPAARFLEETEQFWKGEVKSVSDVYIEREKQ